MANELAEFGPAHRLAYSTARQARLKGINAVDIAVAMITRGLMLLYELDAERALLMTQSNVAYSNDLIIRETEAIILANNGDLESYRNSCAKIADRHMQHPPLLDLSRRVRGVPKLVDHREAVAVKLNQELRVAEHDATNGAS